MGFQGINLRRLPNDKMPACLRELPPVLAQRVLPDGRLSGDASA